MSWILQFLDSHSDGLADATSTDTTMMAPSKMQPEDSGQSLLLEIVRLLVDDQETVRVDRSEESGMTILTVHASVFDIGKLVGNQSRTVRSLRAILLASGKKSGKRYLLNIAGEEEMPRPS